MSTVSIQGRETKVEEERGGGSMKLTVLYQYYGHVIHAGGHIVYRRVTVDLTDEQIAALQLRDDEGYGPIIIEKEQEEVAACALSCNSTSPRASYDE